MGRHKINLSKEELERLYFTELKTEEEIAVIYKCTKAAISYYFKKYKINTRDYKFKKGKNTWDCLTEEEKIKRKNNLSKRMIKYNPLFNEYTKRKRSNDEKRRRGATGILTHMEKNLIISSVGKCEEENCSIIYPLTVHHKDNNRFNNNRGNLKVVCFNCHYILHNSYSRYGYNAKFRIQKEKDENNMINEILPLPKGRGISRN